MKTYTKKAVYLLVHKHIHIYRNSNFKHWSEMSGPLHTPVLHLPIQPSPRHLLAYDLCYNHCSIYDPVSGMIVFHYVLQ
jgi:hypothetical protein